MSRWDRNDNSTLKVCVRVFVCVRVTCAGKETGRKEGTHLSQLLQDLLANALVLKVDPGRLDHLIDDLVVDVAHRSVRHFDRRRWSRSLFVGSGGYRHEGTDVGDAGRDDA